ncbi:hypothetical protein CPI14_06630 [Moraxella catarrhalis]|uniref:hypothetical protein n=1 Tax=Moraxella catarrhalis TaxID=480 RepID=UPI00071EF940|nr:hypothetical protein [Moraxella catarrhalis]AKI27285.1 hypothetical protein [Moraxella phage Mcat6]MCG6817027.1 hypothetical protein [Moraxella catarrhalis]MPW91831.1 hypothetical protein [Moraxella catarrhalis]
MIAKPTSSDLIPKFIFIIMLASLPFACSKAIDDAFDRQAEIDYQECLSWQADGYAVRCTKG